MYFQNNQRYAHTPNNNFFPKVLLIIFLRFESKKWVHMMLFTSGWDMKRWLGDAICKKLTLMAVNHMHSIAIIIVSNYHIVIIFLISWYVIYWLYRPELQYYNIVSDGYKTYKIKGNHHKSPVQYTCMDLWKS